MAVLLAGLIVSTAGRSEADPLVEGERLAPPNIILIMADDLGTRAFAEVATPGIDKMAADGLSFSFAHSTPLCTPTRVQIMTGKYGFRNYTKFGELRPGETTFAHLLKAAGYETCIVGKWQLGGDAYAPYAFGFDDYCLWQLGFSGYHERYHNPRLIRNTVEEKHHSGEYGPRLFTDHLKAFVQKHREGPFFVYYPMVLPHRPNVPVPGSAPYERVLGEERASSDPRFFAEQVGYMDALVAEILTFLQTEGLAERTLVMFTTDNGTSGEIEVPTGSGRVMGQKGHTNLLATHVPFVVWGPGFVAPGVSDRLLDFTDILPTLVEAAGSPLHPSFQTDGISFFADLRGTPGMNRDWIFCHYDSGKPDFPLSRFVFDREWKLYADGTVFNVAEDPLETVPLESAALSPTALVRIRQFESILQELR